MTDSQNKIVHLGGKDWFGVSAIALSVIGTTMTAFIHHDRTLATLVAQHQAVEQRLLKIENSVERINYGKN